MWMTEMRDAPSLGSIRYEELLLIFLTLSELYERIYELTVLNHNYS